MKILITGTGSILGNYLAQKLSKNYKILAIYNKKKPTNLKKFKNIETIKLDMGKKFLINKNFDIFIHCASALPSDNFSNKKMTNINVNGSKKFLDHCMKNNCKKIIFFSSVSVYGNVSKKVIDEKTKINPKDIYGKNKYKIEQMLKKYYSKIHSKILILRLSALLGPKSKNNFLSIALKKIKLTKKIEIRNPNLRYNNLSHVNNISEIVLKFLKSKDQKNFETYNLASKKPIKFIYIFKYFFKRLKIKENIISDKNTSGFNVRLNSKLLKHYPLYTTRKSLKLFVDDNIK